MYCFHKTFVKVNLTLYLISLRLPLDEQGQDSNPGLLNERRKGYLRAILLHLLQLKGIKHRYHVILLSLSQSLNKKLRLL